MRTGDQLLWWMYQLLYFWPNNEYKGYTPLYETHRVISQAGGKLSTMSDIVFLFNHFNRGESYQVWAGLDRVVSQIFLDLNLTLIFYDLEIIRGIARSNHIETDILL